MLWTRIIIRLRAFNALLIALESLAQRVLFVADERSCYVRCFAAEKQRECVETPGGLMSRGFAAFKRERDRRTVDENIAPFSKERVYQVW